MVKLANGREFTKDLPCCECYSVECATKVAKVRKEESGFLRVLNNAVKL